MQGDDATTRRSEGRGTLDGQDTQALPASVPFRAAFWVWARIGVLSFGGPAGQIALMHRELVDRRRWIDESRFLHALNYCMLLPGPEAQQLATYIGWLLHRTLGGVTAGLLFILPGAIAILLMSVLYVTLGHTPVVTALFYGLKAAVLAIVIDALARLAHRTLVGPLARVVAGASLLSLFVFAVPFPVIIVATGALGALVSWRWPRWLPAQATKTSARGQSTSVVDAMSARGELAHTEPSRRRLVRVLVVCALLWATPLLLTGWLAGTSSIWFGQAVFFSKAAVVTFGGAYSVLSYVAQRAVADFGWLRPEQMLDGLGLAETTPGPLILVVQFVAFVGAYQHPGALSPMVAGLLGATVAVWVTFTPCFLWIFVGAPYVEALRAQPALRAALTMISAAVVGVIANLSLWFGMHVLFAEVHERNVFSGHLLVPTLATVDVAAVVLMLGALGALRIGKLSPLKTLLAAALIGGGWRWFAG